jgi:hypothetical protein
MLKYVSHLVETGKNVYIVCMRQADGRQSSICLPLDFFKKGSKLKTESNIPKN